MFVTGKKYHLGSKTFWFFFFSDNVYFLAFFGVLVFISYQIRYGFFESSVSSWLATNYSYIDMNMVAMWLWMILFSFLTVIFLRTSVFYRQYSFTLYKHALHVKQGIFFVKEHVMPYHQIINVDIQRPYLYAPLGLVKLDIITGQGEDEASNTHSRKHSKKESLLPIIDKRLARALAHELMRRSVGEHTQSTKISSGFEPKPRKRRR